MICVKEKSAKALFFYMWIISVSLLILKTYLIYDKILLNKCPVLYAKLTRDRISIVHITY